MKKIILFLFLTIQSGIPSAAAAPQSSALAKTQDVSATDEQKPVSRQEGIAIAIGSACLITAILIIIIKSVQNP